MPILGKHTKQEIAENMKYRIKYQLTKAGKHIYTPQYKKFLFWKCWTYSPCIFCELNVTYNTLHEAVGFLNTKIHEEAEELDKTIIKTTVINYP